ncbi:MAG TPA: glycosyltransferase family 2 protein [Elusimicrobiota bacterium]|nr:glycosyltransferase family 2 protein [Elusimicrobiota bacterium]
MTQNLLLVASEWPGDTQTGGLDKALSSGWSLHLLSEKPTVPPSATLTIHPSPHGNVDSFLQTAKTILTNTPLTAVLFLDSAAINRYFFPLRQLAGADQSLVCFLPDMEFLRDLTGTTDGLRQREMWSEILQTADAVWTRSERDGDALTARVDPHITPAVVPSDVSKIGPWLNDQFKAIGTHTFKKNTLTPKADLTSIIIPTHNDGRYLGACLESIRKHTNVPYEIIVVDNGTTDKSTEFLKSVKDVTVIHNPQNKFFAAACNQGIRAAHGRFIMLLNADTVVTARWLERMIRRMKVDPKAGMAGPHTNGAVGAQKVAPIPYKSLRNLDAFADRWARQHEGGRLSVPRLDGFCLLIKRNVIELVGLLDERFGPGGYEDYDYALRVRQAGFKLLLIEDVYIHHEGGTGYSDTDYDRCRETNRKVFVDKWCQKSLSFLDEVW